MKKRVISTVIALSLIVGTGIQTIAAPLTDVQQQKKVEDTKKLEDINSKIKDFEKQIDLLTDQIGSVYNDIEKNKNEIEKVKKEIKSTQEQVDTLQNDIKEKEAVLGDRLSALYKSGGTENYLDVILSSDNFGDLISKLQAIEKVVNIDNKIIDDLNSKKAELGGKVKNLNSKNDELDKLNIENKAKLDDFNKKKDEQNAIINQLNTEKSKVEVDLVGVEKLMVQSFIDIINNSNSSIDDLVSASNTLKNLKIQIKSPSIDADLVNAIDKAKTLIEQKQAAGTSIPSRGGNGSASANAILDYASQFLGRPYVWGGNGPSSFDCSGFTSYVFGHFGYSLNRTSETQVNQGTPVDFNDLQPGDLVFERGSASAPAHVAIYWGNGQIIHASNPRDGVKVGPISDYVGARRLLK